MACASGDGHTITLSDDGVVHSFGDNDKGQLGLGHNNNVTLPNRIQSLPKIKQIACGANFTFCVDEEGLLWSFGEILGTVDNTNTPKQILDIPLVVSVSCGFEHALIITTDSNLWSCGANHYGQLCLGDTSYDIITEFRQTPFTNISKVSLGNSHSLFQNTQGEICACGRNESGELGIGHFNCPQITPIIIPNLPSNIVQFVCGFFHSLFLDSEGNVYSVGENRKCQLGLSHYEKQNTLIKIPNIPPIQFISCVHHSSFLLDIEGNVWSFGDNYSGQLGQGKTEDGYVPTKIKSLKNIQQISCGPSGNHFLAKDSKHRMFFTGNFSFDTKTRKRESFSTPKEVDSQYSTIWGESKRSRLKSARK